jgi:hypothetical protein
MQGFVLLIMLVYMQVITLAAAHGIMSVIADKQYNHHTLRVREQRNEMLMILNQIDHQTSVVCLTKARSLRWLKRRELSWWKYHGCQINGKHSVYYYVREDIDTDACALLNGNDGRAYASAYYRNTVLEPVTRMMLQDTIILPAQSSETCNNQTRTIASGRQMLRWL